MVKNIITTFFFQVLRGKSQYFTCLGKHTCQVETVKEYYQHPYLEVGVLIHEVVATVPSTVRVHGDY